MNGQLDIFSIECKLGLDTVKMSNCQECPYFEECYVEQLEEISDGKDD